MKKNLILLFLTILFIFSIQSSIQAKAPFSFRLSGGFGMISGGDFNAFIDSQNALFEDTASLLGLTKEGKFKKINWGPDLEAELIFHLNDNLAIGLGAGYILRKKDSKTTLKYESIYYNLTEFQPEISVIPIKLSALYFRRIFSKTKLFVRGGIGLYLGKMDYSMDMDETILGFNYIVKTTGKVTANSIGIHGGMGLEYDLKKNISIFFEGKARYAKLKNWKGEEIFSGLEGGSITRSGTLWYYKSFDQDFGKYYSNLRLSEEKPTGSNLQNTREFDNNLSGISFGGGIRISF